jgi:quercetin dioxygenase-like cupin family protein
MPELIDHPSRVTAAGEPPKIIDEFAGRVNTGDGGVSIAHMRSPSGWSEPGQRPEFDEYSLVLGGAVDVEYEGGRLTVRAGQAVHTRPDTVHRDE